MSSNGGKFERDRSIPLSKLAKDYLAFSIFGVGITTTGTSAIGPTVPLRGGVSYRFVADLIITVVTTTTQIGFTGGYSGGAPAFGIGVFSNLGMQATANGGVTVIDGTRPVGTNGLRVFGFITTSTAGNFQLYAQRSGTAGVTVNVMNAEIIET